jgi:hypothetical protein
LLHKPKKVVLLLLPKKLILAHLLKLSQMLRSKLLDLLELRLEMLDLTHALNPLSTTVEEAGLVWTEVASLRPADGEGLGICPSHGLLLLLLLL